MNINNFNNQNKKYTITITEDERALLLNLTKDYPSLYDKISKSYLIYEWSSLSNIITPYTD